MLGACYETSRHRACRVESTAFISCESGVDLEACFLCYADWESGWGHCIISCESGVDGKGRLEAFFILDRLGAHPVNALL